MSVCLSLKRVQVLFHFICSVAFWNMTAQHNLLVARFHRFLLPNWCFVFTFPYKKNKILKKIWNIWHSHRSSSSHRYLFLCIASGMKWIRKERWLVFFLRIWLTFCWHRLLLLVIESTYYLVRILCLLFFCKKT